MPTIEKAQEKFTLHYQPTSTFTTTTNPSTALENFTMHYQPESFFTPGNTFYEVFSVFTWMPTVINVCEQIYREIFRITWTKYNETEFSEFNRYELHRSIGHFVPVPGGPTLIYQTTDADILEYFDITSSPDADWHYCVLCVLDDGRYCESDTLDANHYPIWGVEWPNVLISNDGSDDVVQNSEYECECTIATDPEGAPVIYTFQFCQKYTEPQAIWTFIFGSNEVPRFVDCGDKNIIIHAPSDFGVKVAGEFWTLAGNVLSDLNSYGPTDKVYVYDKELNFIVFGDNIHGKTPGFTDSIQAHYSNWADIDTDDLPEETTQLWKVGELAPGIDYRMRVFPMDDIAGKRGFSGISTQNFRLLPQLPPPTLVYPENLSTTVNTYWPHFQFYGTSAEGGDVLYQLQCSDDITFATVIEEFDMTIDPSEWQKPEYMAGEMVYFTPPEAKPIISIGNKRGPYYWRARTWDIDWEMWSKWSAPFVYNVEGATFHWRIGLPSAEIPFLPAKDGWNVELVQIGREKIQKKVFRCTMAPMSELQYEALKAEFDRRVQLSLWDNMGENYTVYWGECERSLDGRAFFPDTPAFGIAQKNYIPGALRYWGECVFTEV